MQTPQNKYKSVIPLTYVLAVRLLITYYWLIRYGGNWIEGDAARTTVTIQAVMESGKLIPIEHIFYRPGFLYQVFVSTLSFLSNTSVIDLQVWVLPLSGLLISLIAYAFFFQLLKDEQKAALAAILLNLQGDFFLTSIRGSHEKLDYVLIFTSLLVMALAMERFESMAERVILTISYYLLILAENTSNVFFAFTFTSTIIISFAVWHILSQGLRLKTYGATWLIYVSIMAIVFSFLMMFVWYPPASSILFIAKGFSERIRLFLLIPLERTDVLYNVVSSSWVYPNSWLYLRIYDIVLILVGSMGWILFANQFVRKNISKIEGAQIWLLILFPAFVIQNIVVIASDNTGVTNAMTNIQIRLIPLTIFATVPLAAEFLVWAYQSIKSSLIRIQISIGFSAVLLPLLVILTLLKLTSDPLISNIWFFYSPSENYSIAWLNEHIPHIPVDQGQHMPRAWVGTGSRLDVLWLNSYWGPDNSIIPVTKDPASSTYVLIAPRIQLHAERYHIPTPDVSNTWLIYDNGEVKIYYRPP